MISTFEHFLLKLFVLCSATELHGLVYVLEAVTGFEPAHKDTSFRQTRVKIKRLYLSVSLGVLSQLNLQLTL